jgi:hypothetical protein
MADRLFGAYRMPNNTIVYPQSLADVLSTTQAGGILLNADRRFGLYKMPDTTITHPQTEQEKMQVEQRAGTLVADPLDPQAISILSPSPHPTRIYSLYRLPDGTEVQPKTETEYQVVIAQGGVVIQV